MQYAVAVDVVLLCAYLILCPYAGYLLVTSVAALISRRTHRLDDSSTTPAPPRQRFLVVIPAHDEEAGIARTVRSCLAISYPTDLYQVLVIADNCSDETANRALAAGARVIERFDPIHRSKGHAL